MTAVGVDDTIDSGDPSSRKDTPRATEASRRLWRSVAAVIGTVLAFGAAAVVVATADDDRDRRTNTGGPTSAPLPARPTHKNEDILPALVSSEPFRCADGDGVEETVSDFIETNLLSEYPHLPYPDSAVSGLRFLLTASYPGLLDLPAELNHHSDGQARFSIRKDGRTIAKIDFSRFPYQDDDVWLNVFLRGCSLDLQAARKP